MQQFRLTGKMVNIREKRIEEVCISIENGRISKIVPAEGADLQVTGLIMPGFIDSHVHVESSMLVPSEFARLAVVHGTVGTISDPMRSPMSAGWMGSCT